MKLIVGLGNPGTDYAHTRHNAGFMVAERIAARFASDQWREKFHAMTAEGHWAGDKVMLMKPMTFMNRSGLAVGEALRFYKLEPSSVMVVVDDMALPLGHIRLRGGGGAGGHNGLSDIERAIGTREYPRLRIGVGAAEIDGRRISHTDHVLGRFTDEQLNQISPALDSAADAIECWAAQGAEAAMNRYNKRLNDAVEDANTDT